jgi:hypothetical protein
MTASTPAPSPLVRPFTVAISDSEIEDLKQRLARTRWPNPETVADWSQGVRLDNAKSLIDYWEREYDWRRFESELNRFPQFHPCEVEESECDAAHFDARMARFDRRIPESDWPAD